MANLGLRDLPSVAAKIIDESITQNTSSTMAYETSGLKRNVRTANQWNVNFYDINIK